MPLVVLDATLLVSATAFAGPTYRTWPDIPPVTSNPEADCIGILAGADRHGHDLGLVVSPALLRQVDGALTTVIGLRRRDVDTYLLALLGFARLSGGQVVDDPPSATALAPHLDVPLTLAQDRGAVLVAGHPALRGLGPAWGTEGGPAGVPILGPREFSVRADAARRARRTPRN